MLASISSLILILNALSFSSKLIAYPFLLFVCYSFLQFDQKHTMQANIWWWRVEIKLEHVFELNLSCACSSQGREL